MEPDRTLVLQSSYRLPPGHSSDPRSGPVSRAHLDGIWRFHLRSAPGGRTRLVLGTRSQFRSLRTRVGAKALGHGTADLAA